MSLTERAEFERKWREFPHLGEVLGRIQPNDSWYGYSSVSDNIFARHKRLLEIIAVVLDQRNLLVSQSPEVMQRSLEDVLHLVYAIRETSGFFERVAGEIDGIAKKMIDDLCKRLEGQ